MPLPVIDIFAGPGGLGEGFCRLRRNAKPVFKIGLSIEKDEHAHQTLQLRAFFRQFPDKKAPKEYYQYLSAQNSMSREELFRRFPKQAKKAEIEAWHAELGKVPRKQVEERIRLALPKRCKNWILIGGPPCQAYSLVGRSRILGSKGGMKAYEKAPQHNLYKHYLNILATLQPPVFVMENVKGLLSAELKQKSIFKRILSDLRRPKNARRQIGRRPRGPLEYRLVPLVRPANAGSEYAEPENFVVQAEDFGIPQARHRVIILGIRSDISTRSAFLKEVRKSVNIEHVIKGLPRLRSGLSREKDGSQLWREAVHTITDTPWILNGEFTDDLRDALFAASTRIGAGLKQGGVFVKGGTAPARYPRWFRDKNLKGACNHETRYHMRKDLHRYFYAAVFARTHGRSPLLEDFPKALLPKHKNVRAALKDTKFNDRFRVQTAGRPSTTLVSHISKDGHYYIHYDPAQCRSLTVREAARLQTFPDNYRFEGPRTQQYQQVGNAVPPLLAFKIAEIVAGLFA